MSTAVLATFPASYAQGRLWLIDRMTPGSTAYNMVASLALPPGAGPETVDAALSRVAGRHEALRTSFDLEGGQVVQRIHADARIPLAVHRGATADEASAALSSLAAAPFDLGVAPLARAFLAVGEGGPPVLTLVIHHIVADGETLRILAEDLLAALAAEMAGVSPHLPAAPIEYADYAVWQRRNLEGPRRDRLVRYWTERLAGLPEVALPFDRERGGPPRGGVERFRIEAETATRLRAIARQAHTTLFGVLLTAYAAVLSRVSGQRDIAVGLPVSGRTRVEFERVAGLFINSLVFRARLTPEEAFIDAARRVGADLAADLAHQEMPFELLVETLRPPRRVDVNPLFQTMFQLQVAPGGSTAGREPQLDRDKLASQLDLSLILFDTGTGPIEGGAIFAADLFDRETIGEFVAAFRTLLDGAAAAEQTPVGRLPLLDPQRRAARLSAARGPSREWPGAGLLHEAFAEAVRATPEAPAVEAGGERLSFAALERRAEAIAAALVAAGVRPGSTVAIALPRSTDLVAAMIATLKAGAAYLALDSALPEARRAEILADAGVRAVVDTAFVATVSSEAPPRAAVAIAEGSPAYVIYTSGSTGGACGVAIPHGAAVNHMRWLIDRFEFGPGARVLQRTPPSFDASVWEFWAPLLSGGTLVMTGSDRRFDPPGLLAEVAGRAIDVLQVVPSLLGALLDDPAAASLRGLQRCFCGGEPLPGTLARRFASLTGFALVNLYGPSETTIDATFHPCDGAEAAIAPLGRPIANVAAHVLDDALEPLPAGFTGELCVGGRAVGLGYVGRSGGRAGRFVDDPHDPGGRLFRTGDLATLRADGTLVFRGRIDDQIKLRGHRIEPGEIEAEALRHPAVAEAAAVVHSYGPGDDRLVLHIHPRPTAAPPSQPELLAWLRDRLPADAVPAAVEIGGPLPLTPHGKIDRAAVRSLGVGRPIVADAIADRPASPVEGEIRRAFARTIGLASVGGDDDFFLLGGHSLLVVPLTSQLTDALGLDVTVVDIFEYSTARRLAEALEARNRQTAAPRHAPGDRTEARP